MESVLKYLEQNQKRFLKELCEYIRFPSVSAQPRHKGDLITCAGWLAEHCKRVGLHAEMHSTSGHPIILARTFRKRRKGVPHFVIYGHYDVQPPEPFELWKTPPFEARIVDHKIVGRGASDNKGQHFAHLKAIEAYLNTDTPLPCDLTFLIEGEEEVGSKSLEPFLKSHRAELKCDAIVISDTGMPSLDHPALTYALRGIAALEITVSGPSRDVHSGIYGGTVENPAMALCHMLASLRDEKGHITIPGFYDEVVPLTEYERKQMARLPFEPEKFRKFLGVPRLFGEEGYTPIEQRSARPTLEINGLTSGYQGEGSKTIIPAWAGAKLTMRLVPNQKPEKIGQLVTKHLKRICPPGVRMEVKAGHGGEAYLVSPDNPLAQASMRALEAAFRHSPVLMREGGSIPIVTEFKRILGADSLLLGLALPDDNAHSPNEKFSLESFTKGMRMSAYLWQELTRGK